MAPPDPRAALDGLARLGVPGPVAVELLELQAASVSSPVTLQANSANLVLVRTRFLPENMGPRLFAYPYRRVLPVEFYCLACPRAAIRLAGCMDELFPGVAVLRRLRRPRCLNRD